jgi:hypothetical protein
MLSGCASGKKQVTQSVTLEQAVVKSSDFFMSGLPEKRVIAILGIETPTRACSDFIQQELWKHFQTSGKYTMADIQNFDRIQGHLVFQTNGAFSDESAQSLGHALAAQTIIHGKLEKTGGQYRLTLFSSAAADGVSVLHSENLDPNDPHLKALLEPGNLNSRIENAITEMASRLDERIKIGIDRISYREYGSVTDLAKYLETQVRAGASRLYTRYAVADERDSAEYTLRSVNRAWVDTRPDRIAAMVKGTYYPNSNDDAVVTLNLISTDSRQILGSCNFTVTAAEMKDLNLQMVPENYRSRTNYEEIQRILADFDIGNNEFDFFAQPGRSDALYYDGDRLTFYLYSAEDCYFLVQGLAADGYIQDLYPLAVYEDNTIRAGATRTLPTGEPITLNEPFGEEYILITAYREQFAITRTNAVRISNMNLKGQKRNPPEPGRPTTPSSLELQPVARAIFSYTLLPK